MLLDLPTLAEQRRFYQGRRDAKSGNLPQANDEYYMRGYAMQSAPDRSPTKTVSAADAARELGL